MSGTGEMLLETTARMFGEVFQAETNRAILAGGFAPHWPEIEALGLPLALVPETIGGFGIEPADAWALIKQIGAYALPLPIGETIIANKLLAQAGLPLAEGPATIVFGHGLQSEFAGESLRVSGRLERAPWGASADVVVTSAVIGGQEFLIRLTPACFKTIERAHNIAHHPRDTLAVDCVLPAAGFARLDQVPRQLAANAATLRTSQIAGGAASILRLTVQYVGERVQFGRTLSKFQAVQQELAKLATQAAAASAAADMAAEAVADPARMLIVYAAKARASEAAGMICSIAHQMHGAIGFADEHALGLFTRSLWSWRDEFGSQRECWDAVGKTALGAPAGGLWSLVTAA